MKECKFCGNQLSVEKFINDDGREYSCGECSRYCMTNCKEALKSGTSWHTEPCISCEHNPYAKLHNWNGKEWVKC